jgi:hypothetical protein
MRQCQSKQGGVAELKAQPGFQFGGISHGRSGVSRVRSVSCGDDFGRRRGGSLRDV